MIRSFHEILKKFSPRNENRENPVSFLHADDKCIAMVRLNKVDECLSFFPSFLLISSTLWKFVEETESNIIKNGLTFSHDIVGNDMVDFTQKYSSF